MADPLDGALNNLNTTISSITQKVEEQTARVAQYKAKLIEKLAEVAEQLKQLKDNSSLASIPQLKQQLLQLQEKLDNNTSQLETTQQNLSQATQRIQELENNINDLNRQIADKDKQIQDLANANGQKDTDIKNLTEQKNTLEQEKKSAQDALNATNEQVKTLVKRIEDINGYLGQQIGLINRIADELGDLQSGNVAEQFNIISGNIDLIRKMIDSGSGGAEASTSNNYDIDKNIDNLRKLRSLTDKREYGQFIRSIGDGQIARQINDNISNFDRNDQTALDNIKNILINNNIQVPEPKVTYGGKRRHKTMKKRHRRTRKKMRGGYIYSTSKELDKASSIVSSSSNSKTKSRYRNQDKTRRKSMK